LKTPPQISKPLKGDLSGQSDLLYDKITRRLLPFLFLSYFFAFLDRTNVSYAQLQMKPMLGFSDGVYGLGAGIFFLSYVLFELPSNLWMARSGLRFTLLRIMVLWGLISAGTMLVRTPNQFYIARFLLGLFEAGLFPGIILYLTYWFPATRRGRVTTLFMLAIPIAGLIGGPVSGWIMWTMNMKHGLAGWQWMMLLEGLPTTVLGIICFVCLPDLPSTAAWLSSAERIFLANDLSRQADRAMNRVFSSTQPNRIAVETGFFRSRQVWALTFVYFVIACANYTFTFWLPTMLSAEGVGSIAKIGALSAIPFAFGVIGAVVVVRSSDVRGERRWHIAGALGLAAFALEFSTLVHSSLPLTLMLLSVGAFFHFGGGTLFWTVPPTYLDRDSAPAGIAMISSIGVIGGFISPALLGWIKTRTGRLDIGISSICILMVAGSITILAMFPKEVVFIQPNADIPVEKDVTNDS
jgi:MFS family permease